MHNYYSYSGTDSKDLLDSCDESQEVFSLIKQNLPQYVKKFFLHQGLIQRSYCFYHCDYWWTRKHYYRNKSLHRKYIDPWVHSVFSFGHGKPFKFPPGHKVRMCSFVKVVKQDYNRKISPTKPPCLATKCWRFVIWLADNLKHWTHDKGDQKI